MRSSSNSSTYKKHKKHHKSYSEKKKYKRKHSYSRNNKTNKNYISDSKVKDIINYRKNIRNITPLQDLDLLISLAHTVILTKKRKTIRNTLTHLQEAVVVAAVIQKKMQDMFTIR